MLTLEVLKDYGANVEEGIERCMGNEDFYLKMVIMMLDEDSANRLKDAIDVHDLDKAFETAHALKGVASNLSLGPISGPAIEITELLRARTEMDYTELTETICAQWDRLRALAD